MRIILTHDTHLQNFDVGYRLLSTVVLEVALNKLSKCQVEAEELHDDVIASLVLLCKLPVGIFSIQGFRTLFCICITANIHKHIVPRKLMTLNQPCII